MCPFIWASYKKEFLTWWVFVLIDVMSKNNRHKTILTVSGLSVQRDGVKILDEVSWTIGQGEHWIILGANGSGKTSLLSSLTGYLMPTSGEIVVLDHKYGESDWRILRTSIGLVSSSIRQMMPDEEPALETVVSGKFAMIDLWVEFSKADRARALRILKLTECEYLKNRAWMYLSQGERQRVLIARALMAKPSILILDEPCAGLDPVAREHFLQFLQRLGSQKNSPTLVLVTHHVEEIMPVFTHALLLKEGKMFAQGNRSEMLKAKTFSALFDAKIRLIERQQRYHLEVGVNTRVVM
jgi:iron complex transport system ATP-binding protein